MRVTGMWRHRDWFRCGSGGISASTFCRLHQDILSDFSRVTTIVEGREAEPEWYRLKFVSWDTLHAQDTYYRAMYKKAGIKWGKVTHVRKLAIDTAKQGGASREDISQMSKHGKESIDVSYLPELPPETMHILAGFSTRHGEHMYFVPRTKITFEDLIPGRPDITLDDLAHLIFPRLGVWREQVKSLPSKWEASSRNFFYGTLPFLTKCIVQDGIHWVTELPDHEVSRLLFSVFGPQNYLDWARSKLEEVARSTESIQGTQVAALNAGAQAALASVKDDVATIKLQYLTLKEQNERIFGQLQAFQQRQRESAAAAAILQAAPSRAVGEFGLQRGAAPIPHEENLGPARQRMLQLMPPRSEAPIVPIVMAISMQALLEQHLQFRFEEYKIENKSTWPRPTRMALSKRCYLFSLIKEKAATLRTGQDAPGRLQEAARLLDAERETMSMSAYYNRRKEDDKQAGKACRRNSKRRRIS